MKSFPREASCGGFRQGTPGEGSLRQKRPPDVSAYPPALMEAKEFRPLRRTTKGAALWTPATF